MIHSTGRERCSEGAIGGVRERQPWLLTSPSGWHWQDTQVCCLINSTAAQRDIISHTHSLSMALSLTNISTSPWLYLAEHTRSLWLAAESQQHSPYPQPARLCLETERLFPLQATAAALLSTALIPSLCQKMSQSQIKYKWKYIYVFKQDKKIWFGMTSYYYTVAPQYT